MTDLNRALTDIRSIRRQVAQTTEFHGYGPLTLFTTAFLAVITGVVQTHWLPEPAALPAQYVGLWLTTALLSAALIATQMLTRSNRLHSGMADEMIQLAVTSFLPAAVTGAVLPFVLLRVAPTEVWLLPGLWQIVLGLGIFASCRGMPRLMLVAGVWFLLTGFACLFLGDTRALAPLTMSGPFAVGMAYGATIHHLSAKNAHEE